MAKGNPRKGARLKGQPKKSASGDVKQGSKGGKGEGGKGESAPKK